jgi:hypothetical protein
MSRQLFISSPYVGDEHQLNLSSVSEASHQLAVALSSLQPVTNDYPSQPYTTSFNWQEVIDKLPPDFTGTSSHSSSANRIIGEFYCVAFYSTLRPDIDTSKLHYFDSLAHAEANASGGLLKYWWRDVPDPLTRKNLATCIWTTWNHAKQAGQLPMHAKAMNIVGDNYENWEVERYYLKVSKGNKMEFERVVI